MQAVRRYQETTGRRVSFEYSMVRGVNDSDACAKQLADLIRGMGAHVNLIPINGGRQPLFGYRRRQRPALPAEAGKPRRQRHRPPPSGQRDQRRLRPAPPRRDERQSLRRRIL